MKYLILVSLMVLSLACNKSDDKKGGDKPTKETDVTDLSMCVGPAVAGASITTKPFKQIVNDDDVVEVDIIAFAANSVTMTRTCTLKGKSATLTVRVNARVTPSTIELLSSDKRTEEIQVDDRLYICESSLETSPAINYSFQGPCLKLELDGQTRLFAPAY